MDKSFEPCEQSCKILRVIVIPIFTNRYLTINKKLWQTLVEIVSCILTLVKSPDKVGLLFVIMINFFFLLEFQLQGKDFLWRNAIILILWVTT